MTVIVIAEAGVNHNGSIDAALALVHAAKTSGADVVKFQHFRTETLVSSSTPTAEYQKTNTGDENQAALLRALELSVADFARIAQECHKIGIAFLCTAFDTSEAAKLVALGMPFVKIPSGELNNLPLLETYSSFGLPVLLSTGMGRFEEVQTAVDVLQGCGVKDITVLQCTSLYPAPPGTMNLRAMVTMATNLGLPVGLSDHSLDDHASVAAVALGASVIEKHLTLDRSMPGPDHAASLDPIAFAAMVRRIRETELMLGDGVKAPAPGELTIAALVRRSWHAARDIEQGALISAEDLVLKRPAAGLPPFRSPLGRRTAHAILADSAITEDALATS